MQILVFARAPVPGRCKTRLMPRLGARGAAWVQRRLVEQVLAQALAVAPGAVTLCGAPDVGHPFFHQCRRLGGVRLARQCSGNLGQRMRHALNQALRLANGPVLLIGADAFDLRPSHVLAAVEALRLHDYVLTPATDGGYVLIGAGKTVPGLHGVTWSSGRERAQSRRRLARAGSVAEVFPACADFDTVGDWRRARRLGRLAPLVRLAH